MFDPPPLRPLSTNVPFFRFDPAEHQIKIGLVHAYIFMAQDNWQRMSFQNLFWTSIKVKSFKEISLVRHLYSTLAKHRAPRCWVRRPPQSFLLLDWSRFCIENVICIISVRASFLPLSFTKKDLFKDPFSWPVQKSSTFRWWFDDELIRHLRQSKRLTLAHSAIQFRYPAWLENRKRLTLAHLLNNNIN